MGLAIVRNLINLQNGTIRVKPNQPSGTVFRFSIPYIIGTKEQIQDKLDNQVINISLLQNIKVLIADDDEFNCRLIEQIFKKWNASFFIVHNGLDLLDEFSKSHYDLLLVDIRMPQMDGIQATRNIRAIKDKIKSCTPIIALTATIAKEEIEICNQAGINIVLPKPYTEERLFNTICEVLQISNELSEFKTLPNTVEPTGDVSETNQINFKNLYHLADNDKSFVKEMLQMFIKTTNQDMIELKSGIEAKDWHKVAEYVHKIKSPCKHLDAILLSENLQYIETFARNSKDSNFKENILKEMLDSAESQINDLMSEVKKYLENNFAEIS